MNGRAALTSLWAETRQRPTSVFVPTLWEKVLKRNHHSTGCVLFLFCFFVFFNHKMCLFFFFFFILDEVKQVYGECAVDTMTCATTVQSHIALL